VAYSYREGPGAARQRLASCVPATAHASRWRPAARQQENISYALSLAYFSLLPGSGGAHGGTAETVWCMSAANSPYSFGSSG